MVHVDVKEPGLCPWRRIYEVRIRILRAGPLLSSVLLLLSVNLLKLVWFGLAVSAHVYSTDSTEARALPDNAILSI